MTDRRRMEGAGGVLPIKLRSDKTMQSESGGQSKEEGRERKRNADIVWDSGMIQMTKTANCLAFGSTRLTEELRPKPLMLGRTTAGEGGNKKNVCTETEQQQRMHHTSIKKKKKQLKDGCALLSNMWGDYDRKWIMNKKEKRENVQLRSYTPEYSTGIMGKSQGVRHGKRERWRYHGGMANSEGYSRVREWTMEGQCSN